jgi:hypothetical protein
MATDVNILGNWFIKNANPVGGTAPLHVMNQFIATGAKLTWIYGERLKTLSREIEADTDAIDVVNALVKELDTWTSANWSARYLTYAPELQKQGIDLSAISGAIIRTPTDVFLNTTGKWTNYPPRPSGKNFSVMGPVSPAYDQGTGLYLSNDNKLFYYETNFNSGQDVASIDVRLFREPTSAELDAWKEKLKKTANDLTQTSQPKQAFMQDLMGNLNKYFGWTTSLVERLERDRDSIVARF